MIVNNKEVYVYGSHNRVLEAWVVGDRQNVFSLDYHTDTRQAFESYSYWRADSEVKAGSSTNHEFRKKELTDLKIRQYLESQVTLAQVNDNLKHDEHLDFAVRTGLIKKAFILSTSRNEKSSNPCVHLACGQEEYEDQPLIEFSPLCIPGCTKMNHDRDCFTLRADCSIEDLFLNPAVRQAKRFDSSFFNNYILDIDCDYFNTEKSLYPDEIGTFQNLIRNSDFVTIALEPECVKICRQDGSKLNSDIILSRLLSIIETA